MLLADRRDHHVGSEVPAFRCPSCRRTFQQRESFEKHAKNCANVFKSRRPLFDARGGKRSSGDKGGTPVDAEPGADQVGSSAKTGAYISRGSTTATTTTTTEQQPLLFYSESNRNMQEVPAHGSGSHVLAPETALPIKGVDPDKRFLGVPIDLAADLIAEDTEDSISPLVGRNFLPKNQRRLLDGSSQVLLPPFAFQPNKNRSSGERETVAVQLQAGAEEVEPAAAAPPPEEEVERPPKYNPSGVKTRCSSVRGKKEDAETRKEEVVAGGEMINESRLRPSPVVLGGGGEAGMGICYSDTSANIGGSSALLGEALGRSPEPGLASDELSTPSVDERVVKSLEERVVELSCDPRDAFLDAPQEQAAGELLQCANCRRSFNANSYKKHVLICENVFGKKKPGPLSQSFSFNHGGPMHVQLQLNHNQSMTSLRSAPGPRAISPPPARRVERTAASSVSVCSSSGTGTAATGAAPATTASSSGSRANKRPPSSTSASTSATTTSTPAHAPGSEEKAPAAATPTPLLLSAGVKKFSASLQKLRPRGAPTPNECANALVVSQSSRCRMSCQMPRQASTTKLNRSMCLDSAVQFRGAGLGASSSSFVAAQTKRATTSSSHSLNKTWNSSTRVNLLASMDSQPLNSGPSASGLSGTSSLLGKIKAGVLSENRSKTSTSSTGAFKYHYGITPPGSKDSAEVGPSNAILLHQEPDHLPLPQPRGVHSCNIAASSGDASPGTSRWPTVSEAPQRSSVVVRRSGPGVDQAAGDPDPGRCGGPLPQSSLRPSRRSTKEQPAAVSAATSLKLNKRPGAGGHPEHRLHPEQVGGSSSSSSAAVNVFKRTTTTTTAGTGATSSASAGLHTTGARLSSKQAGPPPPVSLSSGPQRTPDRSARLLQPNFLRKGQHQGQVLRRSNSELIGGVTATKGGSFQPPPRTSGSSSITIEEGGAPLNREKGEGQQRSGSRGRPRRGGTSTPTPAPRPTAADSRDKVEKERCPKPLPVRPSLSSADNSMKTSSAQQPLSHGDRHRPGLLMKPAHAHEVEHDVEKVHARPPGAAPIFLPEQKDRLMLAREERRAKTKRERTHHPPLQGPGIFGIEDPAIEDPFPSLDFLNQTLAQIDIRQM